MKRFIIVFIAVSLILVSLSFADGSDGGNQTTVPHPPVATKQM